MKYAGETIQITVTAKDFDQSTTVTADDVDTVIITILAPDRGVLVDGDTMDWNAPQWVYLWNTPTTPGDYSAEIELTDLAGGRSIEWKRFTLERPRVVAAP